MKTIKYALVLGLVLGSGSFGAAHADYVLDTGVPDNSQFPLLLDGSNYAAAEFALGAGQTITAIQGYINGGGVATPGDSFTITLYAADGAHNLPGTALWSGQAQYQADGWNGLTGLGVNGLAAGNYWAAFEVAASDSTAGLLLPVVATNGSVPALSYAFNAGSGYQSMTGEDIGVQISAVPLPGALLLLGSGLLGLTGLARRKAA